MNNKWESLPTISGHFNRVTDVDWSTKGDFIVSTSTD